MVQWEKLLKSLGFTDSEAKIYLTSLEIGPASVQDLAKKARVSRVTTYAVIESLSARNLMSSVEKGKKKLFVAESPERLVSFVHLRVGEMQTTLKQIEASLEDLKLLQRGEKPVVRLFEGQEALKAIQEDVLRTRPKFIDEFGNLDEIKIAYMDQDFSPFYAELSKFHAKRRFIALAKKYEPIIRHEEEEVIVLPPDKFDFYGDIFVYANKIALSTFRGKHISIIIESEELARTMQALFEYVWHCLAHVPDTVKMKKKAE